MLNPIEHVIVALTTNVKSRVCPRSQGFSCFQEIFGELFKEDIGHDSDMCVHDDF
jgi:hypothetical protein